MDGECAGGVALQKGWWRFDYEGRRGGRNKRLLRTGYGRMALGGWRLCLLQHSFNPRGINIGSCWHGHGAHQPPVIGPVPITATSLASRNGAVDCEASHLGSRLSELICHRAHLGLLVIGIL